MIFERDCELCDELAESQSGLALWPKLVGTDSPSRIVAEDELYVSMVSVGPIARGHCLVLPRKHRSSMSAADEHDKQFLIEFLSIFRARLARIYNRPLLLFEHGAPEGSGNRPCSVSHAHWHVVPAMIQAEDVLLDEYHWNIFW